MRQKVVHDGTYEHTKTAVKAIGLRIMKLVLLNDPILVTRLNQAKSGEMHGMSTPWLGLIFNTARGSEAPCGKEIGMGINTERDIEANLQIGPTDAGMVRIYVEAEGVEIPMDFSPDDALEIADEIAAAAARARGSKR